MRFQPYILAAALLLGACEPRAQQAAETPPRPQLARDNLTLTLNPEQGGRLASMRYRDRERLFVDTGRDAANWGSTLWISPQTLWDWPPPDAFDNLPYTVLSKADEVALTGPVDQQKTGLRIEKTFALSAGDRVDIRYALSNSKGKPVQAAAWEVTRVPIRGLVLFATESDPLWWSFGGFPFQQVGGITWVDLRQSELSEGKLNANGRGWIAWVDGRDLFVKRYQDLRAEQQAPKEAETQLYISPRGYMELEAQGEYREIASGQSISFSTQWQWYPLPAGVEVDVDSPSLVTYLQTLGLPL